MKGIVFGLIGFPTAGFTTQRRWALPGIELGATESSELNFLQEIRAAKSGSPGDILAA